MIKDLFSFPPTKPDPPKKSLEMLLASMLVHAVKCELNKRVQDSRTQIRGF